MPHKVIVWFRVLIVIVALLLGQLQIALGIDSPAARPVEAASSAPVGKGAAGPADVSPPDAPDALFFPTTARDECMVSINNYLLADDIPTGGITGSPPDYNLNYYDTEANPVSRPPGTGGLQWVVVVENSGFGCSPSRLENLTNVRVTMQFSDGGGAVLRTQVVDLMENLTPFPPFDGTLGPGDIAWGEVSYDIPANINGNLYVRVAIEAEAETNKKDDIPPADPDDVVDFDDDQVTVEGPGLAIESFTPDPTAGPPGALIDFELTIRSTRAGINITDIQVDEIGGPTAFATACDGLGNWTLNEEVAADGVFAANETATCTIPDVALPDVTEFFLSGNIRVTETGLIWTEAQAISDPPVTVSQPSVRVEKRVLEITRGGTPISPPAAPGDVVKYEIKVINDGQVILNTIWVMDSLTGPIVIDPGVEIAPGGNLIVGTSYTVTPTTPDPLTNIVSVSAKGKGTGRTVEASAVAAVDIADSTLQVELGAFDPVSGNPVTVVSTLPQTVRYEMIITNVGATNISGIDYVALALPQRTWGTPPALNISLSPGVSRTFSWNYTVTGTGDETDPLVSTVRLRGTNEGGRFIYAQDEATIDISNPAIGFQVTKIEPITDTVLRGGNAIFKITVTNLNSAAPVCDVVVNQYKRDPDTGVESPLFTGIPLTWPTPTPGQLAAYGSGDEEATGSTSYRVLAGDKDPLHMIFEVKADPDCNPATTTLLTDRTDYILDISNVQINTELEAQLGTDGTAQIGETISFNFGATNVGAVTFENLTAEYCIVHLGLKVPPTHCQTPFTLTKTSIASFEDTSGAFPTGGYTVTAEDATVNPFLIEVTLRGTDNRGKEVAVKTATTITVTTENLTLQLNGPQNAVIGDTETYNYTIDNQTGIVLSDARVYNMLVPETGNPNDIYGLGYQVVGTFATLEMGVNNGTFNYTILPNVGIVGDVLTMPVRVMGKNTGPDPDETVLATGTFDTVLIPILNVVKTGDARRVVGEPVNYQVTITNQSKQQKVTITGYADTVLQGYTLAQGTIGHEDFGSPAPGDGWPGGVTGELPHGASVTGVFQIVAPPGVKGDVNPLMNNFIVSGRREDGTPVSSFGTHTLQIGCPIDFNATITNIDDDPDDVLGETLSWQISFTNVSPSTVSGIAVTEQLDQGGNIVWSGSLNPNQTVSLPAFTKQITNDYYGAGEDFMQDTLKATFPEIPGTGISSCQEVFQYNVYSPVYVFKVPDLFLAFTGETVTYTIELGNVAETNDGIYSRYHINTVSDTLLQPNPIAFDFNRDGSIGAGELSGWLDPTDDTDANPANDPLVTTRTYVIGPTDPEELINTVTAEFPDPGEPEFTFYTWWDAKVLTTNPLQVTKTPSATQISAGREITYDYSITNVSPYQITNISFVDDVLGILIPGVGKPDLLTLNPNESYSFSVENWLIPVSSPDPLVNTATATGTVILEPGRTREITSSATASVDLINPDVTVSKTLRLVGETDPLPETNGLVKADVGQVVEYCFLVKNNSLEPATYVDNIQLEDAYLGAGALQSKFETAVGALNPGFPRRLYGGQQVQICSDPITLNDTMPDPLVNRVTLRGETSNVPPIEIYTEDQVTLDIRGQNVLITKTPNPSLAYIGEKVQYTIMIENRSTSPDPAQTIVGIVVTDAMRGGAPIPIPNDLFDWSQNGSGGTPGTLAPGGRAFYTYEYTIQASDPDPLTNEAHVQGTLNDAVLPENRTPVSDSTRAAVAVTSSQLLVRKTAMPNIARPGDSVRYTISITNVGSVPVFDVKATDTRTAGILVPADNELNPYETTFLFYELTMPSVAALQADPTLDPYVNTITVTGKLKDEQGNFLPDPVTATATASVDILNPKMRLFKTPTAFAGTRGQIIDYTITILNIGSDPLTGLELRDITEDPINPINLTNPGPGVNDEFRYGPPTYDDDGDPGTPDVANPYNGQVYNPVVGLPARMQLIGVVQVQIPNVWAENEFTNIVELKANSGAVVDRASATVDVREEGIEVTKRASVSSAPEGASVTYTVEVENIGGIAFDRIVIADNGMTPKTVEITTGFPDSPEPAADDSGTLDPGEVYVRTYPHTLNRNNGDPYINVATVTAYTSSIAVMDTAQAVVDIQVAALDVEKSVCAGADADGDPKTKPVPCVTAVNLTTGGVVTYYVHVSNPSPMSIKNITLSDALVPSGSFVGTWPLADNALAPGDGVPNSGSDEAWFMAAYTVPPGTADPLVNTVIAAGKTATMPPIDVQDNASASLSLVTSDLQLTKTSVAEATVGQTVTYTLTIDNLGVSGTTITNITIVDPLSPNGASAIPACSVTSLAPADPPKTCTFQHTITPADGAPVVNTATASGTQGGVQVSDTASHTINIVTSGISVTKTASQTVADIGDTITFTYVIRNTGTGGFSGVTVDESDPAITFNPAWLSYLGPGESMTRTATRVIQATDPDPYTNTVTVTGTVAAKQVVVQATETVYIANSALVVTNVPDRSYVQVDGTVLFTYTVTNLGGDDLTGLTVSDGLCATLNGQLPSTTLKAGATVTLYCTVSNVTAPGPVVSNFYAQATGPTGVVTDTAQAEVAVFTGGLLVTKTADRTVAAVGDTITYTVKVTNVGSEALTFPVGSVDDSLGITLSPAPPARLDANQSFTMTGTYTVLAGDDVVANTVTVSGTGATSGHTYQDEDSASVAVLSNPAAALSLVQTVTPGQVQPGGTVTYSFTVRNISSSAATGITLEYTPGNTGVPVVVNVSDLGPGNTWTGTRTAVVPPNWTNPLFNTPSRVLLGGVEQDDATTSARVQLLELTKSALPDPVAPGEDLVYSFAIQNLSQGAVSGITLVDDQLPGDPFTIDGNPAGGGAADPLPGGATMTFTGPQTTITVPLGYTDDTIENTAQVLVGGQIVDEDTLSVVVSRFQVEIQRIYQNPGNRTDPLQTGRQTIIEFVLSNSSSQPVTLATPPYTVTVGGTAVTCAHLTPSPMPATIAAGNSLTVTCQYVPPIGATNNPDLTPDVVVSSSGTVPAGTGTEPVSDSSDPVTITLVDLQLGIALEILPSSGGTTPITAAKPGDKVKFRFTLTNNGASRLGCDDSEVDDWETTKGQDAPCRLKVAPGVIPADQTYNDLFPTLSDQVAQTVLNPGASQSFETGEYTVPTPAAEVSTITYSVTSTSGGFWSQPVEDADVLQYYVLLGTQPVASVALTVQRPKISVTVTASPFPNTVIGQGVTYTVTITNTGNIQVENLVASWQIKTGSTMQPAGLDGIVLVDSGARPARQLSGTFTLNPSTTLAPGASATGTHQKPEDQTVPYSFVVTVTGTGINATGAVAGEGVVSIVPQAAGTPTPTPLAGALTPTVDPATLDPNATEPIVTKTASDDNAQPGQVLTWTVTVRNGGVNPMTNVTITDALPETLLLNTATTDRGASVVEGQLVTVTTGQMAPGDTVTVTLNTTIAETVTSPSSVSNTVCAQREGGQNVCQVATVNIGPDVSGLPATGVRSSRSGGWPAWLGIVLVGALMILMTSQGASRRALLAGVFVLVVGMAIVAAVILLAAGGGEKEEETVPGVAQGVPVTEEVGGTPQPVSPVDTPAPDVTVTVEPPVLPGGVPPTSTPYILPTPAGPRALLIPKLGQQFTVPIPIVTMPIVNREWDVSGLGYTIGWLEGTTWMDPKWGNTVLAAHVQLGFDNPGPFWGLGDLVPGDEIVVLEGEIERRFVVTNTRKVDPDDWTVTAPTNSPMLTLITCTEWDQAHGAFSQRMVIQAVPAENAASSG